MTKPQTAIDIFETIPVGIFVFELSTDPKQLICTDANPEALRIMGTEKSSLVGENIDTIWPKATAEGMTSAFLEVVETGAPVCNEDLVYTDTRVKGIQHITAFALPNNRLAVLFESTHGTMKTDALTGLFNYRHFRACLAKEVERSNRNGQPLSMLLIDMDDFANFNVEHGLDIADMVLRRVAHILSDGRRSNDMVARFGGQQFAILLIDTPMPAAVALADHLRTRIQEGTYIIDNLPIKTPPTVSIGVASHLLDGSTPEDLENSVKVALGKAKRRGKNRVEIDDGDGG